LFTFEPLPSSSGFFIVSQSAKSKKAKPKGLA